LNNIITVIQNDPTTQHLDLQEAIYHAGSLFQAALNRFNTCRDSLPGFDDETDRQVAAFADGLVDFMSGNIEWSLVNQRYKVFANDDDRRNNILRLDGRWSKFVSRMFEFRILLLISIVVAYTLFLRM